MWDKAQRESEQNNSKKKIKRKRPTKITLAAV